jgi:hypothetical protein
MSKMSSIRLLSVDMENLGLNPAWLVSEPEFGGELHQPWWHGADYAAEAGAADVAIHGRRSEELSVIEGVKSLDAEFQ